VGSRVHGAASACLVASGLFLCGLGGALAIAEPPSSSDLPGGGHSTEVPGKGPKADSGGSGGSAVSTNGKDDTTDTGKTGDGGNPDNGNCGNGGSNGNAQHCGGGSSRSSPPSVTSPTKTTMQTSTSTKTTTSPTTTSRTTTSGTTSRTTSSETTSRTTSSETTTSGTTSSATTSSATSETTTPTTTTAPGLPAPGGDGDGGGAIEVPAGPQLAPKMQLPPELMAPATEPSVIDVVPGVGAGAALLPVEPVTLPVIVAPMDIGGGSPGAPTLPGAPRGVTAEPLAGREPLPANVGSNVGVPASSYRIGYTEYLRSAGLSQVAALAVPGVAGMLVLTGAGGLVGYRQAKAGHAVHTSGTARFVN
jgi:hypothetical protein